MKLYFWEVKYLGVFLGILLCQVSFGQGGYLPIEPIGQKNSQWCWAASMHMIMDFHSNGVEVPSQCDLAKRYDELFNTFENGYTPNPTDCCTLCEPCTSNQKTYNRSIRYSKKEDDINMPFIDLIFSFFHYTSVEDVETQWMDMENIQKELESCRPFILLLGKLKASSNYYYNHAVVVKGYYKDAQQNEWLLVNDPETKDVCVGEEILLPIDIMNDSTSSSTNFNNAQAVVRFIHPKGQDICNCCRKILPAESNELIALLNTMALTPLTSKSTISLKEDLPKLEEKYYMNSLTISDLAGKNLESLKVLIIQKEEKELAVTLEEVSEDEWKIREISRVAHNPFKQKIKVPLPGKRFNRRLSSAQGEFDIVEYLPDMQQFYRYRYSDKIYLSPVKDYAGIGKKGTMYPEIEILNILKNNNDKELNNLKTKNR